MSKDSIMPHPSNRLWKTFVTSWLLIAHSSTIWRMPKNWKDKWNSPTEKWTKEVKGIFPFISIFFFKPLFFHFEFGIKFCKVPLKKKFWWDSVWDWINLQHNLERIGVFTLLSLTVLLCSFFISSVKFSNFLSEV